MNNYTMPFFGDVYTMKDCSLQPISEIGEENRGLINNNCYLLANN